MATVKFKGLDNIIANSKKLFDDVKTSEVLLAQIGNFVLERIRAETRAGNSVVSNTPLGPLTDSTIAQRREAALAGVTDPRFFRSASFANNTLTGQLLESIKSVIEDDKVKIVVPDTFRSIQTPGETEPVTNAEVYQNLVDLGRDFIGVNDKMSKRIKKLVLDEYRRQLKNQL